VHRGQRRQPCPSRARLGRRPGSVAGALAALGLVLAAGPGATRGAERSRLDDPAASRIARPVVVAQAPDAGPPANTRPPRVAGVPRPGAVLAATEGTWSGGPRRFGYQWERCDASSRCAPVRGARSRGYVVSAADVGAALRVAIRGSNAHGRSPPAFSLPTRAVAPATFLSVGRPAVLGRAEVGRSVRATVGRWTPSGATDFIYDWLRCSADGSGCAPIPGAIDATYRLRAPDAQARLRVRVTAIWDAGSSSADSAPSAIVRPALMRPFPVVHIRGAFTATGATLDLVAVTAPSGARITVACEGDDCPVGRLVRRARGTVRFRELERTFRAGTRFTLRVAKTGLVGKYTSIVIRADQSPARRDRCLRPDRLRPVRCPDR
jgi:hypothetical protein